VFALIVLAGYGLKAMADPARQTAMRALTLRFSAGLMGLGVALTLITLPYETLHALIKLALIFAAGGFLINARRVPIGAWALLIALDLMLMDTSLITGVPQSEWLDRYQPLAQALTDDHAARVYSPTYSLPQQVAAYWNIQTFGGVDPFQFAAFVTQFEAATGVHADGYSVTLPALGDDVATSNRGAELDASLLATWDVSHIVAAYPIDTPDLRLLKQIGSTYVYVNMRYHPVRDVQWGGPNRFSVRAGTSTDGLLSSLRGWTMQPLGERVVYRYDEPDVWLGSAISGIGLSLVTGGWRIGWVRRARAAT
jgi:hypothetical protein